MSEEVDPLYEAFDEFIEDAQNQESVRKDAPILLQVSPEAIKAFDEALRKAASDIKGKNRSKYEIRNE